MMLDQQTTCTEPNKPSPFFTVISICFNDLANLKATAASVQSQLFDDYEWWVIDGASKDGTAAWLAEQRIAKLQWISEPDRGLYHAMNKGMDRALGHYLIFMNSGDCFADEQVLQRMHAAITAQAVAPLLAYGDSLDVPDHAAPGHLRKARSHTSVALGMFAQHQAMAFAATRRRHDESLRLSADYGFIAATVAEAKGPTQILPLTFPVCRFLLGGLNETRRPQAMREDYRIRREVLKLSTPHAALLYVAHWLHTKMKVLAPGLSKLVRRR